MNKAPIGKTVSFTLESNTALSAQNREQLAQLKSREINFKDLPPSPADSVWTRPGVPFTDENKRQVTLRLDADVLDYSRHAGKRYQTRINSVLRAYMQAHETK